MSRTVFLQIAAVSLVVIGMWLLLRPHPLVGVRILPDLKIGDVASLQVDGATVLSLHDGKWYIDAFEGYPADAKKVADFFHSLTNLTVWDVEDDLKKIASFRKYPILLSLCDSSGQTLAKLKLGYRRHGVGYQGLVESTFVVDGSYLEFDNEVVSVREQFKMFWGHDLCFDGFADGILNMVPLSRHLGYVNNSLSYEYQVMIADTDDHLSFTMREVSTDGLRYAISCEIDGLKSGEAVDVKRAKKLIDDLWYIPIWYVRKASLFFDDERNVVLRKRTFVIRSSDGKSSCERTCTLYDCKSGPQLEMDGWVYPIGKPTLDALFIGRRDLVLPGP